MDSEKFCKILIQNGFDFYTGVPCSFFKATINYILNATDLNYVIAANEGAAMGIAGGAYLGGKKPVVIMQNSGLGNTINPLTSLNMIYELPALMFISGRGYSVSDEPQHRIMGNVTHDVLKSIGMKYRDLPTQDEEIVKAIKEAEEYISKNRKPYAFVIKKGTILPSEVTQKANKPQPENKPNIYVEDSEERLKRYDVIEKIIGEIDNKTPVISTTGKISRELFLIKDRDLNFYIQGSMGHTSAVGLGLSLAKPEKKVFVFDGDGAAIMHMGTISTIGFYKPKNLIHIVLDNEIYDSTGGQDTTSTTTRLEKVAADCGYQNIYKVCSEKEILKAIKESKEKTGPTFMLIKVNHEKTEVPRISTKKTTEQITEYFKKNI